MRNYVIVAASCVAACLLAFQNCGRGMQSASWTGDNNGSSSLSLPTLIPPTTTLPVSPPATFAKGDTFNYASVPNPTPMMQTQIEKLAYSAYTGTKAIAVNAQGLGFVVRKDGGTQSDANKMALEGCFVLGGGSPCALLAVGDKFEVSSSELAASYTFTMTAPSTISAATIPFVMPNLRASIGDLYTRAAAPKALVFSVDGAYMWVTASDSTPVTSVAEARRVALERCELTAAITPCTVFAENSTVVFNPTAINRTPVIDYSRTTLMTNVPGMKDAHFTSIVQPYIDSVDGTLVRGSIYIAGDGAGGMAYNVNAATAETNAKSLCEMNVAAGFSCFRYALDKNVQNVALNLFALKSFPELHCQVVPRASCAAHKAMGCNGGNYYVMDGATPKLQSCL